MNLGRIICVLLPFGLTFASLICILTVCLAGITDKSLFLFEITTVNFSASSDSLTNLAHGILDQDTKIPSLAGTLAVSGGGNFTADTLNLADKYEIFLWNYCEINDSYSNCTKAHFNWADSSLDASIIESEATSEAGAPVTLPNELKGAMKSFVAVSRWTQLAYVAALSCNAVEVLFGLLALWSRAGSCLTFFICGLATFTVTIASVLATIQSTVVTASLNSTAKLYNVTSQINLNFLTSTWLAVAFSIAAGIFWGFTSCCCAGSHSSRRGNRRKGDDDMENRAPNSSYQRMDSSLEIRETPQFGKLTQNQRPTRRPTMGHGYEPYGRGAN